VQVTQESFYLPSRTTSKNKVLIWTHKKGHEFPQRFNKTFQKHYYYAYIAQVGSSIWAGKRRERLSETAGGKKSKPSSQKQTSWLRLCNDEPIFSIEENGFLFLATTWKLGKRNDFLTVQCSSIGNVWKR